MPFDELIRSISAVDPALAGAIRRVDDGWKTGDAADGMLTEVVSEMLMSCAADGLFSFNTMVAGFNAFAEEFFSHQMDCVRSGSYRAKDYEAVRKQVYENDAYMASTYYPALLLSYVAAPNYRHILRSLHATLDGWRTIGVNRIIDIAGGHGFLLLYALKTLPTATGVCVDLSPVAGRFSSSLQKITGWGSGRYAHRTIDLLGAQASELPSPFAAAICCELLEHIPNPEEFLNRIRALLSKQGRLFVSAAVRMESVDHLTFFASTEEVIRMVEGAGFEVLAEMSIPFVASRPSDAKKWDRLLSDQTTPVTFIAECRVRTHPR